MANPNRQLIPLLQIPWQHSRISNPPRRPRHNNRTRLQSRPRRQMLHNSRNRKYRIRHIALLHHFPIQRRSQTQHRGVRDCFYRHQGRTHGRKCVETFVKAKLGGVDLGCTRSDVIARHVAEYVVESLVLGDFFAFSGEDDDEFDFCAVREDDRIGGVIEGGVGL